MVLGNTLVDLPLRTNSRNLDMFTMHDMLFVRTRREEIRHGGRKKES